MHEPEHFGPQPPLVLVPSPLACDRDRLAGKAAANELDGFEIAGLDEPDVAASNNGRPVPLEDGARIGVHLHLPPDHHPGAL